MADFKNSRLESVTSGYILSRYEVDFTYDGSVVMTAAFGNGSATIINLENITSELINNYQLVV